MRNEADATVFRAERSLSEYKDKLPGELVSRIQGKVDGVKEALKGENIDAIKSAMDALNKEMQHIGEELQKTQSQQPPQGEQPSSENKGKDKPDIEEADAEIIDDDKNK